MAVFDGTPGNDQYFGTPEADEISGNDGQDQLRGGSGNDTIRGANGPDSLYGDRDDDEIHGGTGDDVVRGGRGSDSIFGDLGVDVLFGDRDDDFLFGGEGNDVLLGGPGDDGLDGGAGADYLNGGDGIDVVSYSDSPVGPAGEGVTVSLANSILVPGSGGHAAGDILIGVEGVIGSAGNDDLDAADNGSIDGLQGGAGNDTLRGGGDGPDHLDGGIGDDHLLALNHGGEMVGGPGNDTFEYAGSEFSGGGILDFAKGEDTIAFAFSNAQVSAADLRDLLRNSTGNVLELSLLGSGFEDFGQLVLNVPVSTLDASDFVIS